MTNFDKWKSELTADQAAFVINAATDQEDCDLCPLFETCGTISGGIPIASNNCIDKISEWLERECDDNIPRKDTQKTIQIVCPKCKKYCWSHYDYCTNCGCIMDVSKLESASKPTESEWKDNAPSIWEKCSNCGENGFANYEFCPWCGAIMTNSIARKYDT